MTNLTTTTSSDGEQFSTAVVEAVAERVGVEPTDLDPPLFRAVDPDALDELLSSLATDDSGTVSFSYRGFDVAVDCDGTVTLEESSDPSTDPGSNSTPTDE
jgi:hypothetical protein